VLDLVGLVKAVGMAMRARNPEDPITDHLHGLGAVRRIVKHREPFATHKTVEAVVPTTRLYVS
jgi:hypothetical protein